MSQTPSPDLPGKPKAKTKAWLGMDFWLSGMVAAGPAAALCWFRDDIDELADKALDFTIAHGLVVALGVSLVFALGRHWLPYLRRVAGDWARQDQLSMALSSSFAGLAVMAAFFLRNPPWVFYLLLWFALWHSVAFCVMTREKTLPAEPESKKLEDELNRQYFVDRIAELFQGEEPSLRRVAILGPWGSGKSMILRLLQQRFEGLSQTPAATGGQKPAAAKSYRVTIVNPWKARTPDEAWAILAGGFDAALDLPSLIPPRWLRLPVVSSLASLLPGVGADVLKLFAGEKTSGKEALLARVNDELKRKAADTRLLILVDDMERADPAVLRSLFHVIDQLDDFASCYFIFAIDPEKVAEAFGEKSMGGFNTRGFMNKVFDLQIPLPEARQQDVAGMLRKKAGDGKSPKLMAAFPALEDLIPLNPRAALQFFEDARARERLFLGRYEMGERDQAAFFTAVLAEQEFPGVLKALLMPEVRTAFTRMPKTEDLAGAAADPAQEGPGLGNLIEFLPEPIRGDKGNRLHQQRLEQILQALADEAEISDLEWAMAGYDKLTALSQGEMQKLGELWQEHAGLKPIDEMMRLCLPDYSFCDEAACVRQLLGGDLQRFKERLGITKLAEPEWKRTKSKVELGDAVEQVKRLRRHYQYALEQQLATDLLFFDEVLFRDWMDLIGAHALTAGHLDRGMCGTLCSERRGFHVDLARGIPLGHCPGLINTCVRRTLHNLNGDSDAATDLFRDHCGDLLGSFYSRITPAITKQLRSGELDMAELSNGFPSMSLASFAEPWLWLNCHENQWPNDLEALVKEVPANPRLGEACAQILRAVCLDFLAEPAPRETADLMRIAPIMDLAKDYPGYLEFFWKAAMELPPENDIRAELRQQRDLALQKRHEEDQQVDFIRSAFRDKVS